MTGPASVRTRRTSPLRYVALLAWIGSLGLLSTGCGDDTTEADAGTVSDTTLVAILADLHLADARAEITGEPADSLHRATLARLGVDSAEVAERVAAATRVPENASALTRAVTDRLQATAVEAAPLPSP
ncbi:MAG: hypothetical protein AAF791_08375 [Bacteroidota bacterium]